MNQHETAWWRRLCSPFPQNAYKSRQGSGGKSWTYIPPRILMNRLDEVVGPRHWQTHFDTTDRGVNLELIIRVPIFTDTGQITGYETVSRMGSGAFGDATQQGNADFAVKGAESNAFRKACSTFGITRDLYREGMPSYIADLYGGWASGMWTDQPAQQQYAAPPANGGCLPPQGGQPQQAQPSDGVRFDPPFNKTGKSTFAWAKSVGTHYQYDLLGVMINAALAAGHTKFTDSWPQEFTNQALSLACVAASRLAHYKGELDQWLPQQQAAPAPAPVAQYQSPSQPGMATLPYSGQNYANAVQQNIQNAPQPAVAPDADPNGPTKKAIVAQIQALIHTQSGRQATPQELIAAIGEISANSLNGSGSRGEVLQSLRSCGDARWLANMKKTADKMMSDLAYQRSLGQGADDDGLPC